MTFQKIKTKEILYRDYKEIYWMMYDLECHLNKNVQIK